MSLFNLLESVLSSSSSSSGAQANSGNSWVMWVILIAFIVVWIVISYFSNKKRRAQAEEETRKRNAIRPGFTVTTIGGIVGTVVSVDDENNTFVLETGSEEHPSQLKFDKQAIYTSVDPDAASAVVEEVEKTDEQVSEEAQEEPFESQEPQEVQETAEEVSEPSDNQ